MSSNAFEKFERWLATACEHPDMRVASVHVGSWGAVSQFRSALHLRAEPADVDVLTAVVPSTNGGSTPPVEASSALAQLEAFASSSVRWAEPKLLDATTGNVVAERVGAQDGLFVFAGSVPLEGGLDMDGRFFVRESAHRSPRVSSRLLHSRAEAGSNGLPVAATLASDAESLTWPVVLTAGAQVGEDRPRYPTGLTVVLEDGGPASFNRIIGLLRTVLTAAVVEVIRCTGPKRLGPFADMTKAGGMCRFVLVRRQASSPGPTFSVSLLRLLADRRRRRVTPGDPAGTDWSCVYIRERSS